VAVVALLMTLVEEVPLVVQVDIQAVKQVAVIQALLQEAEHNLLAVEVAQVQHQQEMVVLVQRYLVVLVEHIVLELVVVAAAVIMVVAVVLCYVVLLAVAVAVDLAATQQI
jgi:hypothetical protein